jgi:hypothetical protein
LNETGKDEAASNNVTGEEQVQQALEATHKCLTRMVRQLQDQDLDEQMTKQVRQSRRQLRSNRELFGTSPDDAAVAG